jgi:hypothetical protein
MSRAEFDNELSESEKNEFMKSGGFLYDGDSPPKPAQSPAKEIYPMARWRYNNLTESERYSLRQRYSVQIID